MLRRRFLQSSLATGLVWGTASSHASAVTHRLLETPPMSPQPGKDENIDSIERRILWENRDGKGETWFHPRACMVPHEAKTPEALMTLQWIRGSDYFGPVQYSQSFDLGKTWSDPAPVEPLGRVPVEEHDGLQAGVCDVVPEYHPPTKSVLALGHVVFYRGARFSSNDQLARYPVYAVRREDGTWSDRKRLVWDDPRGSFIYTNNCGQRHVLPNGDILMAFSFGAQSEHREVAGVRCKFDGEDLAIAEVGEPLSLKAGRGLLEPSITSFEDRIFLTIRAEDGHGYVAVSDDGLAYSPIEPWRFDDGEALKMSTTQQHWLSHPRGLYLIYTRQDAINTNVIRWRSPLWIARVDPDKRCLIRETEQQLLPLIGDGVDDPDGVALMGNFHVTPVDDEQSWVTVGEWLPRRGARGNLLMAVIRWKKVQ